MLVSGVDVEPPTGDPHCPPEVKQAKRIKCKIGEKAEIGDGEDEYDMIEGVFLKRTEDMKDMKNRDDLNANANANNANAIATKADVIAIATKADLQ
mmetsp:Transcript_16130/g.23920  ORF Transcript_16130/g.23920 Transcript_16130/m.23920 type:complete len:96 (+) Transcript_16130:207-494(+)